VFATDESTHAQAKLSLVKEWESEQKESAGREEKGMEQDVSERKPGVNDRSLPNLLWYEGKFNFRTSRREVGREHLLLGRGDTRRVFAKKELTEYKV